MFFHGRRRRSIQRDNRYELILFVCIPYLGSVHRAFAEQDHVARLGGGLNNEFFVQFSIDHALGHLEVRLMRTGHDTKTSVAGIVVPKNHVAPQEGRPDHSVVASVGKMGVVLPGRTINGPSVQLKSFRSGVLCQNHGQMVHPVSLAEDAMKDGN